MIELTDISKRFGHLLALNDVSLAISPRQILGLLGENGAGKSTLMNILAGLLRPTSGTIRIAGRETRLSSPRFAQLACIGMVHQHFKLVPTLTLLENLSLFLRIPSRKLRLTIPTRLERLHWSLPLDTRIEDLAVGQQQRVEILKALLSIERPTASSPPTESSTTPSSFLILDEPTAVLTPQESAELFTALRTLRDSGTGIIFISHKLTEVRQLCDTVAILRRGKLVHTGLANELSPESLAEKMIGTRIELPHLPPLEQRSPPSQTARAHGHPPTTKPLLTLQDLSTNILKSISLTLHPGEILGIAGVDGNGQSDLAQAILGILPLTTGQITIAHQSATHLSIRQRLQHIAFIAEDRHREALILSLSLEENLLLKDYRHAPFNTLGFLRFKQWRTHARTLIQQFDIRANAPTDTVGQLSGGNQQKVVLARELHTHSHATASNDPHSHSRPPFTRKSLVLAINPTRGLDIGATAFVLQKLLDARNRGEAVLLIHSDLDELLAISDRIAVLFNGTLTDSGWPNTTKEAIGQLMLGITATVASASLPMFPAHISPPPAGGTP